MEFDQTHWAPQRRRGPLPTFYYHEHFVEMLGFVRNHYGHVLDSQHEQLIEEYFALSREAQCLYVRLVNRKGILFARSKLRYPELGDLSRLVRELQRGGWIVSAGPEHFEDLLAFLTRAEIYAVLLQHFTGMSRSLRKSDLVDFAREHADADLFLSSERVQRLLVQGKCEAVRYVLFLYFGRIQDGLSQFTMRDLGLVRTQSFTDSYEPRFGEREEALEHFFFASQLQQLKSTGSSNLAPMVKQMHYWPDPQYAGSASTRDKLAFRLGRALEKSGDSSTALDAYKAGESTRCSERVMRLMLAGSDAVEAEAYLERCLENPRSDEEWLVASDIYERKFNKKRTSSLTDLLREAETIDIDESKSGSAEAAAITHFESLGVAAFRTENALWRTLFGLLFWDDLFAEDAARLHSPFEFLPSVLADGTFAEKSGHAIETKLELFGDAAKIKRTLLKTCTGHFGTPNGVFRWRQPVIDAVFALIDHAPVGALEAVMRRWCVDFRASRHGYPDLMVIDDREARFVEIKAEGDQLRRNQVLRIRQLRDAGFRADVVRIRWIMDPRQDYVVVDVETTGGRGDDHRVTEIGAVKVRNGKIVDRFQTLLNPQRVIPSAISRLTGITAEMVADAPFFAEIADEFEGFMGNAIFVAHNVDFDYGFIAQEFGRIGCAFRHPKLCTCASMRRLYPGHSSYSLDTLARTYDIPLKQHHRAMCDAEAAAELLLLINEKRQEQLAEPA